MNEIENNQHDHKIKELVGKVRQELGEEIINNPTNKTNQYLSEIENLETIIPEATKKLWAELGISEDTNQQQVIKEVQRLVELFASQNSQKIKVYFASEQAPKEQLKDQLGVTEKKDDEFHIYLQLDRKDKPGNFCPNLVFWTLTNELSAIGGGKTAKNPDFWQHFDQQQLWVKENLIAEYQKEFTSLLTPSTFPQKVVNIKELYQVYFPNLEAIPNSQTNQTLVSPEIIDKTWQTIKQELIELINQEVKKNPSEEQLKELAIKVILDYNSQEYIIEVHYHPQNPFTKQLEQLITITPLQLEIEYLKQNQAQLPTPENYDKLTKQKSRLENYLQDYMSEEDYQEIRKKIDQIK